MIGLPTKQGNSEVLTGENLEGDAVPEGYALVSIESGVVGEIIGVATPTVYGFKVGQTIGGSTQVVLQGLGIGLPSESDLATDDPVYVNPLTGLITAAGTANAVEVPRAVVRAGSVNVYDSDGSKINDNSTIYGVEVDLGVYF